MRPVTAREVGEVLVLALDDQMSVNDGQSDLYRKAIYDRVAARAEPRVAVDLGSIDFLSSSGVALLVGLRRRITGQGGDIALFGLHPHVVDLLRMMKIGPLFKIGDDEPAALGMLSPSPAP